MPAFDGAIGLGYRYIETDVHLTRDGILLAFHDDILDRVTDRKGRIAEMDYADIKRARVAGCEPIPLMEEILTTWPDIRVNIDPKHDAAAPVLADLLRRLDVLDRVCIGSFSGARLADLRAQFGPELCTSMGPMDVFRWRLASLGLPFRTFEARCAQVPVRHYGLPVVDRLSVEKAHTLGLQVHCWTINSRQEMETLLDAGVDGIMTDELGLLKDVLVARGVWHGAEQG